MSLKSRGTNAERDLIHRFWSVGWAAVRVAGSGSSQFPSPDLLVGNNLRKLALEVKLTSSQSKYFTKKEVSDLEYFASKFGAEKWLAVKFFHQPWYFFTPEDLKETSASFVITKEMACLKGLLFEDLVGL